MTTGLDIVTGVLVGMNVYAPGETIADADAQWVLTCCNRMLDSWSNESLACYNILEQSFLLIPNTQSFTVGPGGQLNGPRPIRIKMEPGSAYLQDNNGNLYYIEVITRQEWNMVGNKTTSYAPSLITANLPQKIFYDPQFPLGIMNVWPVYNGGIPLTLFFDSYLQIADLLSLAATVSLPPGYEKAIISNLKIDSEVLAVFKSDGFQVPAQWLMDAKDSKASVKRSNFRDNKVVYDPELMPRASQTYNVYRDAF